MDILPKKQETIKQGDIVSYTGNKDSKYGIFHKAIRFVSAGIGKANDYSVPVHSGIVVKHDNKLRLAEMRVKGGTDGLRIVDLNSDIKDMKGITRFKMNDKERNKLNSSILEDYKRGDIKYDKNIIGSFLFRNKEKNDLKVAACSEYIANKIEGNTRYDITKMFHKVLPADLETGKLVAASKPGVKAIRGSGSRFIFKEDLAKFAALFRQ